MSNNLNITLVAANQNQKEVTVNDGFLALDAALTEILTVDLTADDVTLTSAQYRGSLGFLTSGNTVARILTLPQIKRAAVWIKNGGSETLSIARGATTLTLAAGAYALYATDGTADGLSKIDLAGSASLAFTALTDAPASYTGKGRFVVRVKADTTGVDFVDSAYTLAFYEEGVMTDAEVIYKFIATVPFTLPSGLSGSYANSEVASTGNVHFDIKKNGSDSGDITFNASASGSFTLASDLSFAAGDILTIVAPATADTTLAGVAVSLKAYLT